MNASPDMNHITLLAADPDCAAILTSLLSGRALRASEIVRETGLSLKSVLARVAGLGELDLLAPVYQGGRRYYRLAGPDTVRLLESRTGLCARTPHARLRTGPRDPALRHARSCYGHLAGELGVWLFERLRARALIRVTGGDVNVTPAGVRFFADFGVGLQAGGRAPVCKTCLDWSERRDHLAGVLAGAVLERLHTLGWTSPVAGSRAVAFTRAGEANFIEHFG